jgi:hypothetical protein
MQPTRRAYLHVGPPKTGTSYLQSVLWQSPDALVDSGYTALPSPTGAVASAELMYAIRGRLRRDVDTSSAEEILSRFAEQVQEAPTPHVVVSQEQLAGATQEQADKLFRLLAGHEVHVVVTVRAIARQVPSAWQERVKTRSLLTFEEFLEAVVGRTAEGPEFWNYQDLPEVLKRWGAHLPPEHVHVVTVPPPGVAHGLLLDRYCSVLGLNATTLTTESSRTNSSLGFVQAELLRRVNVALGDRLRRPRKGYSKVAKWYLAVRMLQPQGGRPPLMPQSLEPWCRDVAQGWIETLETAGYDVVGDLEDLLPVASHFTLGEPRVGDDEVAASAVAALADILALRDHEDRELTRLRSRVAELEGQLAQPWRRGLVARASARLRR